MEQYKLVFCDSSMDVLGDGIYNAENLSLRWAGSIDKAIRRLLDTKDRCLFCDDFEWGVVEVGCGGS